MSRPANVMPIQLNSSQTTTQNFSDLKTIAKILNAYHFDLEVQQINIIKLLYLAGCFEKNNLTRDLLSTAHNESEISEILKLAEEATRHNTFDSSLILAHWPSAINAEKIHNWLVKVTQREFFARKAGQERWQQETGQWMISNQTAVIDIINQLKLNSERAPVSQEYDAIVVLGSTAPNMEKRLGYAKMLIDERGIKTNKLYLLSGERLADKAVDGGADYLATVASKCGLDPNLVMEKQLMLEAFEKVKGNGRFASVPHELVEGKKGNKPRANTTDTILELSRKLDTRFHRLLFISSAPDIRAQEEDIRTASSETMPDVVLEVVGAESLNTVTLNRSIGALGGSLFGGYIRVAKVLGSVKPAAELKEILGTLSFNFNPSLLKPAIPTFEQQIQSFISETYKGSFSNLLTQAEIDQLAWLKGNQYQTNEKNVVYAELMKKGPPQDRGLQEVKRAVSRIYCLELLKQGNVEAYKAFITAQQEANLPDILTQSSFEMLSKNIQILDKDAYQALRVATLLSSVTLSIPAREQATPRLQAINIPMSLDSVEFMAITIDHCPDIYPLARTLSERGLFFLKMAFPSKTHFRHMMYTESGVGMFEVLNSKVKSHQIDQSSLDLWYDYWVINITGFRGHLNPQGSVYLSENTFRAMTTLKTLLDAYIQNPDVNVLKQYLGTRAEWLGLGVVENEEKRLVLAHIAAMLRLYTPELGPSLLKGFDSIPPYIQDKILAQYASSLAQNHEPTPTYGPALFSNALDALSGDVAQTVKIFLPVYASTLENYRALRREATSSASSSSSSTVRIDSNIPLNFNSLAAAPIVKMIIQEVPMDKLNSLPIEIDPKTGEAKLNVEFLKKMLNAEPPTLILSAPTAASKQEGVSLVGIESLGSNVGEAKKQVASFK